MFEQCGTTPEGLAVNHMWEAGTPDPDKPAGGFPVLENARHVTVYEATREDGAYGHHPRIAAWGGALHAVWSNHRDGEDGPGQRVLYARSDDGETWNEWEEIFPSPEPMRWCEEQGLALTAFALLPCDGDLYAVAGLHRNTGFTDFDRTKSPVPVRDPKTAPARAREGYGSLARRVDAGGDHGPVFALLDDVPDDIRFDVLPCDHPDIAETAKRLWTVQTLPDGLPAWDFKGVLGFPQAIDGHRLCEPAVYRAANGRWVMLLRDTRYSHRMYVSLFDDATKTWAPGEPTDIPDSPSLVSTVQSPDGGVLLVGNQTAHAFEQAGTGHLDRDPLTVAYSPDGVVFTRCRALRCGQQEWRVPQSETHGRGGGAQYPRAIIHDGDLIVVYSMGKENIAVSRVPLADLDIEG